MWGYHNVMRREFSVRDMGTDRRTQYVSIARTAVSEARCVV